MKLNEEQITDVLIAALEGGSNYWYEMDTISEFPFRWKGSLTEYVIDQVLHHDAKIKIYDVENQDYLGIFSRGNVFVGLKKIEIERPEVLCVILNEEDDAEDADILFQYIVMGEIVYG